MHYLFSYRRGSPFLLSPTALSRSSFSFPSAPEINTMSSLKQDCIRRSSEEREVNREKVGEQLNVERYGLNGYDEWGVI